MLTVEIKETRKIHRPIQSAVRALIAKELTKPALNHTKLIRD
jgi:hypothetical protein